MKKIVIWFAIILFVVGSLVVLTNKKSAKNLVKEDNQNIQSKTEITEKKVTAKTSDNLVYQTQVDSEEDCSSYEKYDKQKKVCFYECANEQECDKIESAINNELDSWADDLQTDKINTKEGKKNDKENVLASFLVTPTEKITLKSGQDDPKYRELWDEIAALSPDDLSNNYIQTFSAYSDKNSDTIAYVYLADTGKWNVLVNLALQNTSNQKEQKLTLIHELAHIISLNIGQMQEPVGSCQTLQADEGCLKTDAFLNVFYNQFWQGKDQQSFNERDFVSDYAATNYAEDFAESFAYFVLDQNQNSFGNSIREQKIKFFYSLPELSSIRDAMRKTLSRQIIHERKLVE